MLYDNLYNLIQSGNLMCYEPELFLKPLLLVIKALIAQNTTNPYLITLIVNQNLLHLLSEAHLPKISTESR